jgi:uncharacterized protein
MSNTIPLVDKLNADFITTMKSGDKLRLETLRSLRAVLKEKEISLRGDGKTLGSDDVIAAITSAAKKRKEAISEYEKAGRTDRVETEKRELEIIQQYLPDQMTPDEIVSELRIIIHETGASGLKDIGRVMPAAMQKFRGRVDGKEVQSLVKQLLTT